MSEEDRNAVYATGRTSEIHLWGPGRVIKLFHADIPPDEIDAELAASCAAFAAGATPIACHGIDRHQDRPGLVFDRLTGGSLTSMAEKNLLRLRESGRLLAQAHVALHQCKDMGFADIREATVALVHRPSMGFLDTVEKDRLMSKIKMLPGGNTILHMDFHTNNVFEHQEGLATIDWQTPLCGPPAADVAMTNFLLCEAELWPGVTWFQKRLYNAVRRVLKNAYAKQYLKLSTVTQSEIDQWRIVALVNRLAVWDIASERAALRAEIKSLVRAG